ncbi:DUF4185 domain-containing protein [Mucilaginibacter limnophilus]|uniref:DUF4185 domain-containing protein n=1 Tax=Mucilaginibacter limnophilus TaxID=1932778 RepID=A0A3S2WYD4_9SPHI|nr:DUF4185 domain-containing protein [Mucilaginibacter limnophilus]RVU00997.1 DUF4185 domain-containing protein [Mucilaginibacter limnophilus]
MRTKLIAAIAAIGLAYRCRKEFTPVDKIAHGLSPSLAPIDVHDTMSVSPTGTTTIIARQLGVPITGEGLFLPNGNTNTTWGLSETDMNIMFETDNHEIASVFGDNFRTSDGNNRLDWKSNAMAFSSDRDLRDGMTYSSFVAQGSGIQELIDVDPGETTKIPTAAISIDGRMYIHYMAVLNDWNEPSGTPNDNDEWTLSYGEIAYSDDYGQNWIKSGTKWAATSNFAQAAYLKDANYLYMFGTQHGRHGKVYLARVLQSDVLVKSSYRYYTGNGNSSSTSTTDWSANEADARPVTPNETSEFSVAYSTRYKRYFMMYLSIPRRAIVFRDAKDVTGPWSEEKVIAENVINGQTNWSYAAYFHPWSMGGDDLYFVVSHTNPKWSVFMYHTKIGQKRFNMVSEGDFEEFPSEAIGYQTQWKVPNSVSAAGYNSPTGCKLANSTSSPVEVAVQTIAVKKNTTYKVTAMAKASTTVTGMYFGIRRADGTFDDYAPSLNTNWQKISRNVTTGNNTSVDVRAVLFGAPGVDVTIDNVTMEPL